MINIENYSETWVISDALKLAMYVFLFVWVIICMLRLQKPPRIKRLMVGGRRPRGSESSGVRVQKHLNAMIMTSLILNLAACLVSHRPLYEGWRLYLILLSLAQAMLAIIGIRIVFLLARATNGIKTNTVATGKSTIPYLTSSVYLVTQLIGMLLTSTYDDRIYEAIRHGSTAITALGVGCYAEYSFYVIYSSIKEVMMPSRASRGMDSSYGRRDNRSTDKTSHDQKSLLSMPPDDLSARSGSTDRKKSNDDSGFSTAGFADKSRGPDEKPSEKSYLLKGGRAIIPQKANMGNDFAKGSAKSSLSSFPPLDREARGTRHARETKTKRKPNSRSSAIGSTRTTKTRSVHERQVASLRKMCRFLVMVPIVLTTLMVAVGAAIYQDFTGNRKISEDVEWESRNYSIATDLTLYVPLLLTGFYVYYANSAQVEGCLSTTLFMMSQSILATSRNLSRMAHYGSTSTSS